MKRLAAAALLVCACGVKAPPRPPEKAATPTATVPTVRPERGAAEGGAEAKGAPAAPSATP